jgi:sugar-specific transcriptional regulator TrmB
MSGMLEAVGVTGIAERIYAQLIETDVLSAPEIAERCSVSTRRATSELARLVGLGLAIRLTQRPVRYRAVAPDLSVSALIAQREKELTEARAVMHQLSETFQETSRGRHPNSQVEVVHGAPNIARAAARINEQARYQMRGFDRPPYAETPGTSYPLERRRLAAGVTYRVIYDSAALGVPGRMDEVLRSAAAGEQARARPELPIKLIISDDQLALIPAAVTSRSIDIAFVIHKSPILSALIALFEAEWARASPIPGVTTSAADAGGPPDAETAMLLAMLAAGMTDASIARSLSWSMRTTQRRMRQLMSDLGVTSRFQAGAAARERGWL